MSHGVRHIISVVVAVILMVACEPKVPETYIQPDDMEDILYDFYVSKGMAQLPGFDSYQRDYRQDLYLNMILKKYHITRADFDSSLVYYYTRADKFVKINKNVQDRLADEALKYGATAGEVERFMSASQNGDTANIWTGDKSFFLMPYAPRNIYQFTQRADTAFRKGDSFMLAFNSTFLFQGGSKDAVACLAVRYENDSIASHVSHFSISGSTTLRLSPCDLKAKEIKGFVYLGKGYEQTSGLRLLFANQIRLIRMRRSESAVQPKAGNLLTVPDTVRHPADSVRPRQRRLGERPMPQLAPAGPLLTR